MNHQPTKNGEKDSAPNGAKQQSLYSPAVIAIAGIGILVVLCLILMNTWQGDEDSKNEGNENTTDQNSKAGETRMNNKSAIGPGPKTQISAIRLSDDQKFISIINGNTPEGQIVFEGERSRLEVLLPERSYLMVLGIVPATGDAKVRCLWPKEESTLPYYCDGLIYGKRPAEQLIIQFTVNHQVGVRSGTWKFSDGPGLHSFIVISSQTLMPSFEEVKEELLVIDWPTGDVSPGHWTIQDGEAFVHEYKQMKSRGNDDKDAYDFQPVVDQISSLFEDARVDGVVFSVEKKSTGK